MSELVLIAALARNRVIGQGNQLCWHISEDLARFKDLTSGQSVIMGRKTWESLPSAVRPLPGRQNIVVTHQVGYVAPGAHVSHSLEEAVRLALGPRVFVIGGEQLYQLALPLAAVLELTEVDLAPEGDAFFPQLPDREWREASRTVRVSRTGVAFSFVQLVRR